MINNPSNFTPDALEAAKKVLELRESGDGNYQEPVKPISVAQNKKPSKILSKLNTSLKSVAIYQIISSLFALQYLVGLKFFGLLNFIFFILFLLTYSSGLIGGIMLLKRKEYGFNISLLFNAIQVLRIAFGGFSFFSMGIFGLYIDISFTSGIHFNFFLDIGSKMAFLFYDTEPFSIGINFVAILAMIIIIKAKDIFEETGLFSDDLLNNNIQLSE